ncbi:hypothetical protein ABVT39_002982 [Epinephelus coioides]
MAVETHTHVYYDVRKLHHASTTHVYLMLAGKNFGDMSADNSGGNVSVPLRNLLNSIQCVRDWVRDQAVKAVSQEATKLSLAFSRPPLPSQQTDRKQYVVWFVSFLTSSFSLPPTLLPLLTFSLSQEQLTSTGGVWSACDHFAQLPQDNKAAVLVVLSNQIGVVKDAIEETQQASKLAALLKKVLEIIRSSHVCGESQLTWVQFLDGAVDHNLQKAKDFIQQDS